MSPLCQTSNCHQMNTCITCHAAFPDMLIQRQHYETDWHRYNLKRQVAELPAVPENEFNEKVATFKAQAVQPTKEDTVYCTSCVKTFQSKNAFENHLRSKKHIEGVKRRSEEEPKKRISETVMETKEEEEVEEDDGEEDEDEEGWHTDHGTDSEDELFDETKALPVTCCLFCSHSSSSLESSLRHMNIQHGFIVPDGTYCTDMNGLISYLGLKVGAGRMCLFCPEKKASFVSVNACQKHMRDKEHCKIARDTDALLEIADYYDYESMYTEEDEEVLDGSGWTMTLPSGASIGHRSLLRFYRQNLKPVEGTSPSRIALEKARGAYAALAWTGCTGSVAQKAAKDIQHMERIRRRFALRVGVKSNKLFKSRGRSDQ